MDTGDRGHHRAMSPDAVTVATMAEPVVTRMPTAVSQPSNRGEIALPAAALPIASPTPPAMSTCLKPPPAPMMSTMPAIGARLEPRRSLTRLRENPRR